MIGKYRGGAVPAPPAGRDLGPAWGKGSPLAVEANETADKARIQLEDMDLSGALETIWVFVRRLNRYVEEQAPWKLAKEAGAEGSAGVYAAAALDGTLWDLAEGLRLLSVVAAPVHPADVRRHPGAAGPARRPPARRGRLRRAEAGAEPRLPDPSWEGAQWGLLPAGSHRGRRRAALPSHRGLTRPPTGAAPAGRHAR